MKPQAKQLDIKVGQAHWDTTGFTLPNGNSGVVTALLSGETPGGDDTTIGVYVNAPQNKIYMRLKSTGKALEDSSQRQIFGRLSESAGVWTIAFFVLIAGSETAFDFTGHSEQGNTAEFRWCETVQLKDSNPTAVTDYAEGIDEINASNPLAHDHITEVRTVTAQDTITALSQTPKDDADVILIVNKLEYDNGTDYTISGTAITWIPGTAGFNVETTDEVVAVYQY